MQAIAKIHYFECPEYTRVQKKGQPDRLFQQCIRLMDANGNVVKIDGKPIVLVRLSDLISILSYQIPKSERAADHQDTVQIGVYKSKSKSCGWYRIRSHKNAADLYRDTPADLQMISVRKDVEFIPYKGPQSVSAQKVVAEMGKF